MSRAARSPAALAALAAVLAAVSLPAWAQTPPAPAEWQVRLGAGAGVGPEYPGSEELKFRALPDVDVTWHNLLFLNVQNGVGIYAVNTPGFTLGASVGLRFGRDEDDGDRLRGLGDIDTAAQARLFARYLLGPVDLGATLARDLGGSDGFTLDLSASHTLQLGQRWRLTPGITATLGDEDYMQTWFGINAGQSARSGQARYDADAGLVSAGAFLRLSYAMTPNWILGSAFKVEQLLGDAADSPLVEQEIQPSLLFSISYRF